MRKVEYGVMYREEDHHWWYVSLHDLILAHVPRNKPDQRILDAGCGTGRLLQRLQVQGNAVGCDTSVLSLHFCARRGVKAFWSDLNTCNPEPARYDMITLIDVLYHRAVRDEEAVLRKMQAALKPGGRLILQVPAYEWLRSGHDDAVHTGRRYTRKQVTQMLKASGFLIEQATYRVAFLFMPIAVLRLVQKLVRPCSGRGETKSDVKRHAITVNALCRAIMQLENLMLHRLSLPFGTSVFVVARKQGTPPGDAPVGVLRADGATVPVACSRTKARFS